MTKIVGNKVDKCSKVRQNIIMKELVERMRNVYDVMFEDDEMWHVDPMTGNAVLIQDLPIYDV